MKICKECNQDLPLESYSKDNLYKDKLHIRCKLCKSRKAKEAYRKNPERWRGYILKKKYGISYEMYELILKNQNYKCAICLTDSPKRTNNGALWVVDHDHNTGQVRGVLCNTCNLGLGYFHDSTENLSNAIEYLWK